MAFRLRCRFRNPHHETHLYTRGQKASSQVRFSDSTDVSLIVSAAIHAVHVRMTLETDF